MTRRRVILESPYAANDIHTVSEHVRYARECLRDSVMRGEAPIASHLLYTQPGVLDDDNPDERAAGIECGLEWGHEADATVVYCDMGVSIGMMHGIRRARWEGRAVEMRRIRSEVSDG